MLQHERSCVKERLVSLPDDAWKSLQRFVKLGRVTKLAHPYLWRHSCVTEGVRNGAKLHGLQRALGHALVAMTGINVYPDEGGLEQVAAVMPSVLGRWEERRTLFDRPPQNAYS